MESTLYEVVIFSLVWLRWEMGLVNTIGMWSKSLMGSYMSGYYAVTVTPIYCYDLQIFLMKKTNDIEINY